MQDADIFFIPAWYRTDCFSACHFKKLESHRPHTFFVILREEKKVALSYFPPDLSMNRNLRVGVLRTAEGMISRFMIFDNNELSGRRRRSGHFHKTNSGFLGGFFALIWKEKLKKFIVWPRVFQSVLVR